MYVIFIGLASAAISLYSVRKLERYYNDLIERGKEERDSHDEDRVGDTHTRLPIKTVDVDLSLIKGALKSESHAKLDHGPRLDHDPRMT